MFPSIPIKHLISAATFLLISLAADAATLTSKVYSTDGGKLLGEVTFEDSAYGLLIKPKLSGLPAGLHGFHIHMHADCGDKGMHAGGHLDPKASNSHLGPYAEGHLGDLPVLIVNQNGEATSPLLAPRLSTNAIKGHALMIHEGGDNYSNTPSLGGGGARIGCGKIA